MAINPAHPQNSREFSAGSRASVRPTSDREDRNGDDADQKVFVGYASTDSAPVLLDLFSLNRHTAILAGSGSGKSVTLRRIVEEAALLGVPAIVLDTNNDLARLGQQWPEIPPSWNGNDTAKAQKYHENVEVIIWTPLLSRGNPLTLAPIPDFNVIKDEPDELRKAVLMVASSLKPYAIPGGGQTAALREGILTNALHYFAAHGAGTLDDFITLLSELPDDAGANITDAAAHAQKMADQLRSAIAINPLLATSGPTLDPSTLLSGSSGKTRISVINLSGLPSDEQKQSFVNQLAMILFTWIKKRPASADRPLQGLLVMDEAQNFVPSQRSVASKTSMISLTQQGRKYGLGLIFATQAPKGIDHQIILNCTTQMIGKANSPTAIDAAQELLRNKGGGGDDVARLGRGQFYLHTEGFPKPLKIQAPLCLSHHPETPPSEEEVVILAQRSRNADSVN